jgi:PIN domain nuclease of toxin-antitoxin system
MGKLEVGDDLVATLVGAGAVPLSIDLDHAELAGRLPAHHRDPFDRLLVAQALSEDATVVSRDPVFRDYGVLVTW